MRMLALGCVAALGCGEPAVIDLTYETVRADPLPVPLALPPVGDPEPPGAPAPAELTIQFVERLPEIDFVPGSSNPTVEGWPAAGDPVTWRAHVKNWFPTAMTVGYRWRLDGVDAGGGSLTIGAGAVATADYAWRWTFDRHALTFVVDPDDVIAEEEEHNNQLSLDTDALSVGFYIEQSLYDHFRAHQHELAGMHSTSFEDWAQRQIALYNELFRRSVYPETPSGVIERLRLDRITVVPDDALPLDASQGNDLTAAATRPNLGDRTVDLQWGFPSRVISYNDVTTRFIGNPFYFYSGGVQHEMGHARGMIDVYAESVFDGIPGHRVDITEAGTPISASRLRYERGNFSGHDGVKLCQQENGLMATDWTYLDRLSAIIWNRMKGQRAHLGNYNEPPDIGWFLNALLPADNRIRIVDGQGRPVPGAHLDIYQASPSPEPAGLIYGRVFDGTPDLAVDTDGNGEAALGPNPFARSGPIISTEAYSNATAIVRAEKDGVAYFCLFASDLLEQAVRGGGPAAAVRAR